MLVRVRCTPSPPPNAGDRLVGVALGHVVHADELGHVVLVAAARPTVCPL